VAKKQRSAKQKAATRKLVALNRRKSAPKRRKSAKTRKPNKRRKPSKTVARKTKSRNTGRGTTGFINKIPILRNKTVQRVGFALGMGSIATIAAQNIPVPQVKANAQLIGTGVAFATDPLGGIVRLALSGGLGQLGNLFGGGNSSNGGNGGGMNGGFA